MIKSWNSELALKWTKMVGPSRPTCTELSVYQKYVQKLQKQKNRQLEMLVLGSTPEFRDWGFENNLKVSVIDCNHDYHETINREIRHKILLTKENFIERKWQTLDEIEKYDIIIGDLVTGNLAPEELEPFLNKINLALISGGYYLGKSFYRLENYIVPEPENIVKQYYYNNSCHPYSFMIYDFSVYCLRNDLLNFKHMYTMIKQLHENGIMDSDTFSCFCDIGLESQMSFQFYIPPLKKYLELCKKYFKIEAIEYNNEIYSKQFPLVILRKEGEYL